MNGVKNRKLYNMIHHEIVGKAAVNKLGFVYEPDETKCREHMFNDIRVCLDLKDNFDLYENIEKDLETAFAAVISSQVKAGGEVLKVHKIVWDRVFFFPYLYYARYFEAAHWVRLYTVDRTVGDSHVQNC